MNARRMMEAVALAVFAALLLYAGWRGAWLPLQLTLGVLVLRWLWQRAPLALLTIWLWPDRHRD